MKKILLGGYSYYCLESDERLYPSIFDNNIAPILKFLYTNENYKFSLYITYNQILWLESKRPEIVKLIDILLKRKSLTLLFSSSFQALADIIQQKEILLQSEAMALKIRQVFKAKADGFFAFEGFWQSDFVPLFSKADISYSLVPINRIEKELKYPFIMSKNLQKMLIIPTSIYHNATLNRFLESKSSLDKFLTQYSKEIDSREYEIVFFNIDDFVKKGKDFSLFINSLFSVYKNCCFYTTDDISDIGKAYFLPSARYTADSFEIFDFLYSNQEQITKLARINYIEELLNLNKKKKKDFPALDTQFKKLTTSMQFIPGYYDLSTNEELYKSYLGILKELLVDIEKPPRFDMLTYSYETIKNKNNISFLDLGDATIKEIGDFRNLINLLHGGYLFKDMVAVPQGKTLKVFSKHNQFSFLDKSITQTKKKYTLIAESFCDLKLEIKKEYTFKNYKRGYQYYF